MTYLVCTTFCSNAGFSVAGVEYGRECCESRLSWTRLSLRQMLISLLVLFPQTVLRVFLPSPTTETATCLALETQKPCVSFATFFVHSNTNADLLSFFLSLLHRLVEDHRLFRSSPAPPRPIPALPSLQDGFLRLYASPSPTDLDSFRTRATKTVP